MPAYLGYGAGAAGAAPPPQPGGPSSLVGALRAAGLLLYPHAPSDAVPVPGAPLTAAPGSTNRLVLVGLSDDGVPGAAGRLAGATVTATLAQVAPAAAGVPGAPPGGWTLAAVQGAPGDYAVRWPGTLGLVAGRRYRVMVVVQLGPDRVVLTVDVLVAPFGGGAGA